MEVVIEEKEEEEEEEEEEEDDEEAMEGAGKKGVKYTSKDLEVENDYPAAANTAALKAKHDRKLEKKEAMQEQIC